MKQVILVAVAALVAVSLLAADTADVCASGPCWEKECTKRLECLVTCPQCNGTPFDPGTCWWS